MTTVHEFVTAALAIVIPIVAIGMLVCLALLIANIGDELRRKPLRLRHRVQQPAVRPITGADLEAAQADLDAWEAEMYANLDAALPPSWAQVEPRETTMAAQPWPEPLSPRLTDYATGPLAPQPLPARDVAPYNPAVLHPDPYLGQAAWWQTSMRDGDEYYVEPYAGRVLQNLSRTSPQNTAGLAMSQAFGHVVDAMPVSPAPQGRTGHRYGTAPGTDTQRRDAAFVSWEQPTGAFALVGVR